MHTLTRNLDTLLKFHTWLLESNTTKTKHVLRRNLGIRPAFCIEGAMCEFYRLQTGIGEWRPGDDPGTFEFCDDKAMFISSLSPEVAWWFGVSDDRECRNEEGLYVAFDPPVIDPVSGNATDIATLNDKSELSLVDICEAMIRYYLADTSVDQRCYQHDRP